MIFFKRSQPKIFVIGRNKTGTTSMEHAFKNAGFKVGEQAVAENLMEDWGIRDFKRIIKFCKTADVFQDVPFSLPYTYQAVDVAFPNSKFILTVRETPEQWYTSLTNFHKKLIGKNRIPTAEDLCEYTYVKKGWLWRQQQLVYGVDENSLYNKDIYIRNYNDHIADVERYFRYRPNDFLRINLSDENAEAKLNDFVGFAVEKIYIPHINVT